MIHFSLTAVYCFEDGDVGKQTVAGKKYCAEKWLKKTPGKQGHVHIYLENTYIVLPYIKNIQRGWENW